MSPLLIFTTGVVLGAVIAACVIAMFTIWTASALNDQRKASRDREDLT